MDGSRTKAPVRTRGTRPTRFKGHAAAEGMPAKPERECRPLRGFVKGGGDRGRRHARGLDHFTALFLHAAEAQRRMMWQTLAASQAWGWSSRRGSADSIVLLHSRQSFGGEDMYSVR